MVDSILMQLAKIVFPHVVLEHFEIVDIKSNDICRCQVFSFSLIGSAGSAESLEMPINTGLSRSGTFSLNQGQKDCLHLCCLTRWRGKSTVNPRIHFLHAFGTNYRL